eukprot:343403-Pyramimonas_sp.AAC.1
MAPLTFRILLHCAESKAKAGKERGYLWALPYISASAYDLALVSVALNVVILVGFSTSSFKLADSVAFSGAPSPSGIIHALT